MNLSLKPGTAIALVGAFALGAMAIAYSTAQPSTESGAPAPSGAPEPYSSTIETSFSDLQEDEIRSLVRDYLMTNPEVIIEAVEEYSRQQQARAEVQMKDTARASLAALLDPENGYVTGRDPENAKVAIIELYDYHCGFCKRAAPLVKNLVDGEKDVKVAFREYPILREESDFAAEVSLAARDQGKFLDMHFAMMKASGTLTEARLEEIAKEQGVDIGKLEKSRGEPRVSQAIVQTIDIAREMGVQGTPAFIIASVDGEYINVVEGFDPQRLLNSIDEARAAAK